MRRAQVSSDHLYTDAELYTLEDPDAADVNEEWDAWIRENYIPVRSLTSGKFTDLQFLKPLLEGRILVQLGESGHGVSEFDSAKVRLIKFLHQEMGFDVIAFESSIFSCFYTDERAAELAPAEAMRQAIFGVWHAEEVLELFQYIKETRGTSNPLTLAGFDIQYSGRAEDNRAVFMRDVITVLDSTYAQTVYDLETEVRSSFNNLTYEQEKEYLTLNRDRLVESYEEIVSFFDGNMDTLKDIFTDRPLYPVIARQAAWSMIRFIYEMTAETNSELMIVRDEGMAENVSVLVNTMYPGRKIIMWAHNYHIRHNEAAVTYGYQSMGFWVKEEFRPVLYTVGLYMYRGQAALNNREIYDIASPAPNSLEAICYRARCKYLFVDMLHEEQNPGNAWMFQPIKCKSWGKYDHSMILREQYDAILFIDTVKPPDYL
jgi:erythromycin esterase